MNISLLKYFFKKNWLLWLGFTAFLLFELVVCIFMMDLIAEMMPEWFLGGISGENTLGFISYLLPLCGFMFPMVFYILLIYRMLHRPIDSTSISPLFAAGVKRHAYITSAAIFLTLSLFAMFTTVFVVCGLCMLFWGAFNWGVWLGMVFCVFLVTLAVAFASFFFAAAFAPNSAGKLGMVGLPIIFLVLFMISEYINFFKYLTPFGWMDFAALAAEALPLWWLWSLGFMATSVTLYIGSVLIFRKRQLSI